VGNDASLVAFPTALLYETVDVNPYNLDYPVTPAAVTFPESGDQVAAIIKCAADADVKVQAKSGGHSYANYGRCSICISCGEFFISYIGDAH
jgi:FAD/FMN-containing dehydrogenase